MMRSVFVLLFTGLLSGSAWGVAPLSSEEDAAFLESVHAWYGCESCHLEGQPDRVPREQIPAICGDCHKQPLQDYTGSVHWEEGRAHSVCTDCHGVHGILPVRNSGSKAYRSLVCGTCHPGPMENFLLSSHASAFEAQSALACASCHSNHRVTHPTMASVEPACTACHPTTGQAYQVGQAVKTRFTVVRDSLDVAAAAIDSAKTVGLTVARALTELSTARATLTQARLVWHALDTVAIAEATDLATLQAARARAAVADAFATRSRRRFVLIVIWIAVAVNVLLLYGRKRRADREVENARKSS